LVERVCPPPAEHPVWRFVGGATNPVGCGGHPHLDRDCADKAEPGGATGVRAGEDSAGEQGLTHDDLVRFDYRRLYHLPHPAFYDPRHLRLRFPAVVDAWG